MRLATVCVIPSVAMFSFVFFEKFRLGCTVAAVSAKQPVEHVENALQNITTEEMMHSVIYTLRRPVMREVLSTRICGVLPGLLGQ